MRGDHNIDRRTFLGAGAVGLTSAAAGLSAYALDGSPAADGDESVLGRSIGNDTEASPTASRPDGPAATFAAPGEGNRRFRLRDLPRPSARGGHPAPRTFSLDVSPGSVVLSADEADVRRPVEFVLRVRDDAGDRHVFGATHGPSSGRLEVEFDVGDLSLPTTVGGTATVHARDTHPGGAGPRRVAVQHHVGVPYRLSDGRTGTYWASGRSLNGPIERTSGCVHETLERANDYVVVTAQRFEGSVFGASVTIPKAHYRKRYRQRFHRTGRERISSVQFAARRDDEYLNRYARDLARAIELAGFTDPREKVLAAARTVQTLRYKWGKNPGGGKTIQFPHQLLINCYGVCSGRTVLLAYLLGTEWFGGMTTAYGDCRMRGVRHWAPGIDVRDLGYEPGEQPDDWYTFSPTEKQGFEYTEYVFLESIAVRDIGEFDDSIYTKPTVWDTVDLKYHDSCC